MKKRQKKIFGILLSCLLAVSPVMQAGAATEYDAANGVNAQLLFPGDSLTGAGGAIVRGEETLSEGGSWTNDDKGIVYAATSNPDNGTIELETVGYMLDVENGTSSTDAQISGNHYTFGEWEKPEVSTDRAYYPEGTTVKITAAEAPEGMEFSGWKTEDSVDLADASSAETTFTMPDRGVTLTAEYREIQQETQGTTEAVQNSTETSAPETAETSGETAETSVPESTSAGDDSTVVIGGTEGSTDIVIGGEEDHSQSETAQTSGSYTLTVENGTGSGSYTAGSVVTVEAQDPTGADSIFAGWFISSMNAGGLTDESGQSVDLSQASLTFVMPEADVTLTAQFSAPETQVQSEESETASESETQVQSETASESETQVQSETVTESETQVQSETVSESEIQVQSETASESETQVQSETASESETQAQSETVSESETQAQSETASESETQVQSETVPESGSQSESSTEPIVEIQSETTQAETAAVQESETTPATEQSETPETYQVTVEDGSGSGTAEAGTTVNIEADQKEGYTFQAWSVTEGNVGLVDPSEEVTSFVMPASNVTVLAQYVPTQYTVTLENAVTADSATAYAAGTTVTVTPADRTSEKFQFDYWEVRQVAADGTETKMKLQDNKVGTLAFQMPASNIKVTAVYTEMPSVYTVTVANGTLEGGTTQTTVEEGTSITVTANPSAAGYAFSRWLVNNGTVDLGDAIYNSTMTLQVNQDLTIQAEYEGIPYDITVEDGAANYENAVAGTVVTITADEAPEGQEFDYWQVDTGNVTLADSQSETTTFEMTSAAVQISAHYRQVEYEVTVENGSSAADFYYMDDTVTVSSNYPASGRVFDQWVAVSGNVTFADASRWQTSFTMPSSDVVVRATYKDGPSPDDNQIQNIVAGGEYYTGDTISFTAAGAGMSNSNPNPGDYRYRPASYQIGNVTGTWQGSPYTISMAINATGEYTLKVIFNRDVYDGSNWVADGTTDTKSVTFRVVTRAAGVATGDETPIYQVIAIAAVACVIFVALLVTVLRKRRR